MGKEIKIYNNSFILKISLFLNYDDAFRLIGLLVPMFDSNILCIYFIVMILVSGLILVN